MNGFVVLDKQEYKNILVYLGANENLHIFYCGKLGIFVSGLCSVYHICITC